MPELTLVGINLGVTLGAAVVLLLIAFAIGVASHRHRVVDIFWGLGFAVVALTTLGMSSGHGDGARRYLVTALTVVWGVRLAGHIAWRGRGEGEDPRYDQMLARAPGSRDAYALRMIYLLQAVSLWFISWPVQVAQYDPDGLSIASYIGVALFAVGLFFESVGDWQLAHFKRDPANKGTVMDRGLWRYTRHPNYFGDACVWWGLWLMAADSWPGLVTIVCPLLMTYLLTRRTGKPTLEAHMSRTRPGYAEYVRRTSGFLPLPPKS